MLDHQYGEIAHISRTVIYPRERCIPSPFTSRTGACRRSAARESSNDYSNSIMLLRAAQRALRSGARRKSTVVMMRHGESTWNLENKFTGM